MIISSIYIYIYIYNRKIWGLKKSPLFRRLSFLCRVHSTVLDVNYIFTSESKPASVCLIMLVELTNISDSQWGKLLVMRHRCLWLLLVE